MKKILFLLMLLPTTVYCADINWVTAGKPSPVPNDGNVYFITGSQSTNANLEIQGQFEVRGAFFMNHDVTINGGTFTVLNGNTAQNSEAFTLNTGNVYVNGTFNNGAESGTVTINGGRFQVGNATDAGSLAGETIDVTGGIFHVELGQIDIDDGGTLNITGSSFIFNNANISRNNDGVFRLFDQTLVPDGGYYINSGLMASFPPGSYTVPAGKSIIVRPNATFEIDYTVINNGTLAIEGSLLLPITEILTNNGTIILINGGSFTQEELSTYNANGVFLDFNTDNHFVIPLGKTGALPLGLPIDIEPHQTLNVLGNLLNQSPETLNVNGSTYIYGSLYNGDASNPGTINVNPKGRLYLLSGRVKNDNVSSVINVKPLGSLYNYHGQIDLNLGGASSLDVSHGGKLHNMSSSDPGIFTIPNGGNYLQNTQVSLEKSLEVDYTWTITEQVTIKGNANTITFGPDGQIRIVGPNASLLLDDIILENVSGTKIRCTDANTTLSLHNVIWTQDTNFDFTWGKINVTGEWLIEGKDTAFNFQSAHGLKIEQDSTIHFKQTTLNYNINTNNLIQMVDDSSQINLERARILATQSCTLTNGTLLTTGRGTLQGTGTLDVQGMNLAILGSLHHIGDVVL